MHTDTNIREYEWQRRVVDNFQIDLTAYSISLSVISYSTNVLPNVIDNFHFTIFVTSKGAKDAVGECLRIFECVYLCISTY